MKKEIFVEKIPSSTNLLNSPRKSQTKIFFLQGLDLIKINHFGKNINNFKEVSELLRLHYTDCTVNVLKVSKGAKIRNRYNQVPHLTKDTNGKVANSQ